MNKDFFAVLNTQNTGLIETIQKLNKLAATNVEKLSALQVANLQAYTSLGIERLKVLAEVKTSADLQNYVAGQVEVLKTINERLMADTKALVALNAEFNAEIQKLAQNSMTTVLNQAA